MKKYYWRLSRRLCCLLFGLLVLAACKKEDLSCRPYTPPVPSDTYVFPVKPGTPAWAALQSGAEMVAVCQVPATTLRSMSTEGLIATCLDYPLLFDMTLANSLQRGARAVMSNFNGFGELQSRPTAAALLLDRYQRMRAACLPKADQRGAYSFTFSYVEMIVAQDEYLNQLSSAQRRVLLQETLNKYVEKQPYTDDVYGIFGLKTTALVMARIMQAERYAPFLTALSSNTALQVFITDVNLQGNPETLDVVVNHAKQFN